jgi:ParB family transcriptional regulator, chromosome partitioning protein
MALGTKVKIVPRSEHSGKLEIEYYSMNDLQRIYETIVPEKRI